MHDGADDDHVAAFAARIDEELSALRADVDRLRAATAEPSPMASADLPAPPDVPRAPAPAAPPPPPHPTVVDIEPTSGAPATAPPSKLRTLLSVLAGVVLFLVAAGILLISVGPRFLPYQTYFMRSHSMEPGIPAGAIVVLTEVDAAELHTGDIVTFTNPGRRSTLVTHRIVGVETSDQGRVFVTKGDANRAPDPWLVPATGTSQRYWFDVPVIGFVFGFLATPTVRVALLAVPVAVVAVLAVLAVLRSRRATRRRPAS